jgi:hypothetical protein
VTEVLALTDNDWRVIWMVWGWVWPLLLALLVGAIGFFTVGFFVVRAEEQAELERDWKQAIASEQEWQRFKEQRLKNLYHIHKENRNRIVKGD